MGLSGQEHWVVDVSPSDRMSAERLRL